MPDLKIACSNCGIPVQVHYKQSGVEVEGAIALGIPGIVCGENCREELEKAALGIPLQETFGRLQPELAVTAILEAQFTLTTQEAIKFFVMLFPMNTKVIHASAIRLFDEGHKKTAYDLLEHGMKQTDDTDELRLEVAVFAGMDGVPQYGLEMLKKVSPGTPRYYVIKGNLLRAVDQWDEAAACWQTAIEIDPDDIVPWFNLGAYLSVIKENYLNATDHYLNACLTFPSEPRFRAYLGDAYFYLGRKMEAVQEYQKALRMPGLDDKFESDILNMIDNCYGY